MSGPDPSAEVLRRTSRTFALSIQLLPAALRAPVESAYLVARIADTIADAASVPALARIELLDGLVAVVREEGADPAIGGLAEAAGVRGDDDTSRAERALLADAESWLRRLRALPAADRRDVERVVLRLAATMRGELAWLARPEGAGCAALPDATSLAGYTEGIAGCVGEFWTSLLDRHACRWPPRRRAALAIAGRRYGRGLQLVNVLRDVAADRARGRCFLPRDELAEAGVAPADVLAPASREGVVTVARRWSARARRGLLTGLAYSSRLEGAGFRVRLATALPAAIGLETLARLEDDPHWLDPERKTAISRARLRAVVLRTAVGAATARGPRRLAALGRPRRRGAS